MKAFPLSNAPHLPVTGESHPLIRESSRWITTGNVITLLAALILFGILYLWPQTNSIENMEPPVQIADPRIFDRPPQIVPNEGPRVASPQKEFGEVEPVPDDVAAPEDGFAGPNELELDPWEGVPSGPFEMPKGGFQPTKVDTFVFFDELPMLVSIAEPVYPDLPRQAGIEGTVLVKVLITRTGKVKNAVAIEGPEPLRKSAVDAAWTALFTPALQGDVPVEVWVTIPVAFYLNR